MHISVKIAFFIFPKNSNSRLENQEEMILQIINTYQNVLFMTKTKNSCFLVRFKREKPKCLLYTFSPKIIKKTNAEIPLLQSLKMVKATGTFWLVKTRSIR